MNNKSIPWNKETNTADYPNVQLDFILLEHSCGLLFSETTKKRLLFISNLYKAFKQEGENNPQQPIATTRKKLKSIQKASELLAESMNDFVYGSNTPGSEASRIIYSLLDNNILGWIEQNKFSDFLTAVATAAGQANTEPAPLGRKKDEQIRLLIQELHKVFAAAGGTGLGCFTDGATASGYAGPFYALACELIRQIDGGPMTSGLGKMISSMFHQEKSLPE